VQGGSGPKLFAAPLFHMTRKTGESPVEDHWLLRWLFLAVIR
jgi:hypothetical protein